jgi:ATP-binding cassette subfamily C (CFTR/MRP) protein 1
LNVPAGAKVGVCGRTGSGKSSLLLSLLRLNLVSAGGDIVVDGVSLLRDCDLETARRCVGVAVSNLFLGIAILLYMIRLRVDYSCGSTSDLHCLYLSPQRGVYDSAGAAPLQRHSSPELRSLQ